MSDTPPESTVNNDFQIELASLLNKHGLDNNANTPDYVLARYLVRQLDNFRESTDERETWFGVKLRPGMVKPK